MRFGRRICRCLGPNHLPQRQSNLNTLHIFSICSGNTPALSANSRHRPTAAVTSRVIASARPRRIVAVSATAWRSSKVKPSRFPAKLIWCAAVHDPVGL